MGRERRQVTIQRVLSEGPFSIQEIANETGLSYDALLSWAHGRRVPRKDSMERLAHYLDRHGKRLQDFADELRRAAE